jgi:hypothetical protein
MIKHKIIEEGKLRHYEFKILKSKRNEVLKACESDEDSDSKPDILKIIDKEIDELKQEYGFNNDSESETEVKSKRYIIVTSLRHSFYFTHL